MGIYVSIIWSPTS